MSVDDPVARRRRDIAQEHILIRKVEVEVLGADLITIGTHDAEAQVPDPRDKEVPEQRSVQMPCVDVLELTSVSSDLARVRRVGLHGGAIDLGMVGVDEHIEIQGFGNEGRRSGNRDRVGGK